MINKVMAILYFTLVAFWVSGCGSTKPEGKLVGTMSVYRTDRGFLVVSDQNGERMIVNFNVQGVIIKKKKEVKGMLDY
jgi:hypothetical protein